MNSYYFITNLVLERFNNMTLPKKKEPDSIHAVYHLKDISTLL